MHIENDMVCKDFLCIIGMQGNYVNDSDANNISRFRLNGPLRRYFILNRTVSQSEIERRENMKDERKMYKQPPLAPTASAVGPFRTTI